MHFENHISGKKKWLESCTQLVGLCDFKFHVPVKIAENEEAGIYTGQKGH